MGIAKDKSYINGSRTELNHIWFSVAGSSSENLCNTTCLETLVDNSLVKAHIDFNIVIIPM